MAGGTVRVLVVDDSDSARAVICALLESEGGIQVVGEARNGREAVQLARSLRPDIITMDLEMPVMDGMAAIEEIMTSRAIPILVVSNQASAQTAYAAISLGALEVMAKPDLDSAEELADKLRMLAGVPVITHLRMRPRPPGEPAAATPQPGQPPEGADPPAGDRRRVIAIASSTGGPQALAALLPGLPASFSVPVLVAQHISDGFAAGMAEWLNTLCPLPVTLAQQGERCLPGHVYIAPSETHLTLNRAGRMVLLERGPQDLYRPSCDHLLMSVAEAAGARAVGVILTGMGSDGVQGMEAIQRAGGQTLAQDEASSVVYGMNKLAIDGGWVGQVVPLALMAHRLVGLARG